MQFATYSQPKMAPIVFLVDHNANNKKSDIAYLEKDCSPWNAICGFDTRGVFAFKAIFLRTDEEHGFARYTGGKFSLSYDDEEVSHLPIDDRTNRLVIESVVVGIDSKI